MSDIKYDGIGVESDGDIIFITVAKYKLFMSYGKIGMDAKTLYEHLMFTARLQATNKVWATNKYLREGLSWGKERLLKAKNLLYELDLIYREQVKNRVTGEYEKTYLVVKTKITYLELEEESTGGLVTGDPQTRRPVTGHKCFNKEVKCLNEKENYVDILDFWNIREVQQHKKATFERNLKRKHITIIDEHGKDEVQQAILNYSTVINSDLYYFSYRWSLWNFIERGVDQFIDSASPLSNFRIKDDFGKEDSGIPDEVIYAIGRKVDRDNEEKERLETER